MSANATAFAALIALGASLVLAAPAAARDRRGVDYGRQDNSHYKHGQRQHRTGAWVGHNRGALAGPHAVHNGPGHGQFSPRGQGGHHWGW
jgi:hypothetical protein